MAESIQVGAVSNCSICLGGMIKPRILPCSHSFCEVCLSEYIISTVTQPGQNRFNCPVCRNPVVAEDEAIENSEWVYALSLKLDEEIPNTVLNSKKQLCHPCKSIENEVNATVWCCECNEAMCANCGDIHKRLKISSSHKTVSVDTDEELDNRISTLLHTASEFCSIHESRRLEMYCANHDKAICIQCLSTDHRRCENLETIDNKDALKEENLNLFKGELGKLLNAIKTLIDEKTENKQVTQTRFSSIESQSLGIITELKVKLDDLYIEFLKKSGLQQDELQNELDQTLKSLSKYSSVVEEMIQEIEIVTQYGTKVQALTVTENIKRNLSKIGETLFPMLSTRSEFIIRASFDKISEMFSNLNDLGNLLIARNTSESLLAEDVYSFKQSITAARVYHSLSLSLYSTLEVPLKTVASSVQLNDDLCAVLTQSGTLEIIEINTKKSIKSLTVSRNPKKLCFDSSSQILYGSCSFKLCFLFRLKDKQLNEIEKYNFLKSVCAVDVCDGKWYTVSENAIHIFETGNFENRQIWMRTAGNSLKNDISFDEKSKQFAILNVEAKTISFGSVKTKLLTKLDECNEIKEPQSIAFGPSGILFVAETPSKINIISSNRKNVRTLTMSHKIETISDITVSHDMKRLYVSGGSFVEIYDINSN